MTVRLHNERITHKLKFLVDKLVKIVAREYFLVNFASEIISI